MKTKVLKLVLVVLAVAVSAIVVRRLLDPRRPALADVLLDEYDYVIGGLVTVNVTGQDQTNNTKCCYSVTCCFKFSQISAWAYSFACAHTDTPVSYTHLTLPTMAVV